MARLKPVAGLAVAGGLALAAGGAFAAGPWPGLASSVTAADGAVRYRAARAGAFTVVSAVRAADGRRIWSGRVRGAFGIPAVTLSGSAGGLSADGRVLVLAQPPSYEEPRSVTRFVVVPTRRPRAVRTIAVPGDFGFDALSPDAQTLYLIEHRSLAEAAYAVRAYDLRRGLLLPGAIVDKREASETMRGFPIARATGPDGTWVYTLYTRPDATAFVHALDTRGRTAVCVDLPWRPGDDAWKAELRLADGATQLLVRLRGETVARIDTRTLEVLPRP